MSKSKGFAYTTFAILSSAILLSILFGQVYQPSSIQTANSERIGDASFFLDSVLSDMDRSLEIATRRSLTGATNYVVTEGESLSDAESNVSEVMVNGTLAGQEVGTMGNASLDEWEGRVSDIGDRSGYRLNVSVSDYSFDNTGFSINSSFTVEARLFDPTTLASFNRTGSADFNVSVEELEDPMITLRSQGRYTKAIERCAFQDPAARLPEPSQNSSTTAYGEVVMRPSDGEDFDNQQEKILAVQDPDAYSSEYTTSFEGVVSEEESSSPGSVNPNHALGVGSIDRLDERPAAVITSDGYAWSTGFARMFEEGCYAPSGDGPDFFERLENDLSGDGDGLATLIDVTELPSQLQKTDSAVAHVYFNDSRSPQLQSIEGVTDEYSWFRLDSGYIDAWDIEGMVQE